jgi:hypothetical protein
MWNGGEVRPSLVPVHGLRSPVGGTFRDPGDKRASLGRLRPSVAWMSPRQGNERRNATGWMSKGS